MHLFVLSVIRLAGNENAGTEGGKHRRTSDADMKKAGQGDLLNPHRKNCSRSFCGSIQQS